MTPCLCSSSSRLKVALIWSRLILATRTRDSALFNWTISGITLIRAMISPSFTICPASFSNSEMIPDICGLISTSSRGSTFPVATVFVSIVSREGVTTS